MDESKQSFEEIVHKLSIIQQQYEEMNLHEDLFSLLLTRTDEIFLLMDEDGLIRAANPACKEQLGFSAAELMEVSFFGRIHPEDGERVLYHFSTIKQEISAKPIEFRFLHARGCYIWLEAGFKGIGQDQLWKAFLVQIQEITDRKLIEEQLELKEKVFENALEGILITDLDGRILMVNPAFCTITGYSKEEVLAQNPRLLKSGLHPPEFFDSLWETLKQSGKWEGEIWNRRKTGEIFVEGASIRLIQNEQRKAMYYASVFTDITKRKEEEAKLLQDLQLAKQVQKSVLSKPIRTEEIEIDAFYLPSEALGGDMYAWYEIDRHRYGIILLDVVGHGVAASLISMSIRSLLRGLITRLVCPEMVMKELNRHMRNLYHHEDYSNDHFFTAIYCLIDTRNRVIEYCNAGHPCGLLVTEDGEITRLNEGTVPIGLLQKLPIQKHRLKLAKHCRLLLFTDGIMEPGLKSYETAIQEWEESLLRNLPLSNQEYLQKMNEHYIPNATPHSDDICVVSITIP